MLVAWGICSSTTYLKPTKKPPVCQDVCCAKPTDRPRLPVCGGGPFLISTRIPFAESRLWNGHDGGAKFTSELFSHIPQHSSRWISRLSSNYLQSKTATQTRNVKMPVAVPTNSSARPESRRLRIGVIGLGRMARGMLEMWVGAARSIGRREVPRGLALIAPQVAFAAPRAELVAACDLLAENVAWARTNLPGHTS
jgi:hypothetical protein